MFFNYTRMPNLAMRDFWGLNLSDLDEYGFMRGHEYKSEEYQSFMSNYFEALTRRSQKWEALLMRRNPMKQSRKLKMYIRQGVPYTFRSWVWLKVSGAEDLMSTMPDNFYDSLLEEQHNRAMTSMVALDIHRTYPDNIFFRGSSYIQSELYNVLTAYAHHNPTLGYCQGLNYIAGMLILATKCEEKSFWLLKVLIENILEDYYSNTMEGVLVDIEVLSELIRMRLPDVHRHMSNLGLPWAAVTTKWFVCLYADLLPAETVFRIWDCLFSEGSKIIFRVAITLIKKYRTQLLDCNNLTEAVECFKKMTSSKYALNCHEFMQSIFQETRNLSNSTIQKLRGKIREEKDRKEKEAKKKKKGDQKGKKKSSKKNLFFGGYLKI